MTSFTLFHREVLQYYGWSIVDLEPGIYQAVSADGAVLDEPIAHRLLTGLIKINDQQLVEFLEAGWASMGSVFFEKLANPTGNLRDAVVLAIAKKYSKEHGISSSQFIKD